jgi:hypothetical protein
MKIYVGFSFCHDFVSTLKFLLDFLGYFLGYERNKISGELVIFPQLRDLSFIKPCRLFIEATSKRYLTVFFSQ